MNVIAVKCSPHGMRAAGPIALNKPSGLSVSGDIMASGGATGNLVAAHQGVVTGVTTGLQGANYTYAWLGKRTRCGRLLTGPALVTSSALRPLIGQEG